MNHPNDLRVRKPADTRETREALAAQPDKRKFEQTPQVKGLPV